MIIKFDGIDGCGKSTLCRAIFEWIEPTRQTVLTSEFSSPSVFEPSSGKFTPHSELKIKEAALSSAFSCDDIERQLLLHFLSYRKNRIELPKLHAHHDVVIVDRSTLSNLVYSSAVDERFEALFDLVFDDLEAIKSEKIVLIDTDVEECSFRLARRGGGFDEVESKGRDYMLRVRKRFMDCANKMPNVFVLDGNRPLNQIREEAIDRFF